jgi:hypothetical protein
MFRLVMQQRIRAYSYGLAWVTYATKRGPVAFTAILHGAPTITILAATSPEPMRHHHDRRVTVWSLSAGGDACRLNS